jgi:DNA polymerase III subunit delta
LKLNSDSLGQHLAQRLLRSYLVSGDEPLLAGEAADAIRARARAEGFSEREVFFMDRGADWNEVRAAAGNLSLFGARRVLEIRLPTGKPGAVGSAALVALVEAQDPDTLLLILTPRLDRDAQGSAWVKAIESHGGWIPVWPVNAERLVSWLRARARQMQLELSAEALGLLAERTEGNLLAAHQELQKLQLAGSGEVSAATVLASVADSARFDVFQLGEAVLSGDAARALRMLAGLRAEGEEPVLVLWTLSKALRDLWGSARGPGAATNSWQRQSAALAAAARRAPRLPFQQLAARATRADRVAKGRIEGDVWDELVLFIGELCGHPMLPVPRPEFQPSRPA